MEVQPEIHPAWYRDVSPMRYLILGSFPPHRDKHEYEFFYPNRRNRFWKILAHLAGETLQSKKEEKELAVEERHRIMKKLNTGVQNLGLEIERKGKSALDTNIKITRYQDIISIIDSHPELEKILLPGYSAKNSTAVSFIEYLRQKGVKIPPDIPVKAGSTFNMEFKGRVIECVILNSTSPASPITFDLLLEQFRRHIQPNE